MTDILRYFGIFDGYFRQDWVTRGGLGKKKISLGSGFAEALEAGCPDFLSWLSGLPAPWMVVPAALEHIDPETVVVQPSDVGKTPETVRNSD